MVLTDAAFSQTWEYLGLPDEIITAIAVQGRDTIYASTPGSIFKTTNAGATWDTLVQSVRVLDLKMHPQDVNILYAALGWSSYTVSPTILKTTNAGLYWFQADSGIVLPPVTGFDVIEIDPLDPEILFVGSVAIAGGGNLYRTTNGGQSWIPLADTTRLLQGVISIAVHPETTSIVYAGTPWNGDLLRTRDGGESWSLTGLHDVQAINSVAIDPQEPQVVYATSPPGYGILWKSIDGGNTWTTSNTGLPISSGGPIAIDRTNRHVYVGVGGDSATGGIHLSTNLGQTWQRMGGLNVIHRWSAFFIAQEERELYLGTSQFGLFRTTLITSIETSQLTPPTSPLLLQSYPNPFNSSTTLEYSITNTTQVTIALFNILGKEVKELANEKKPPGRYTVRFHADNLSSGIYICRLQTSSGYTTSIKLGLVR